MKIERFLILVSGLLFPSVLALGQLLLENFNYTVGTNLTDNSWSAHNSGGTNPIPVSSGGLTYAGYVGSGIGNSASLNGIGEDVNRTFTSQSSGTIYVSFLLNMSNATTGTGGEYFLHLNSATFFGRIYALKSGSNIAFGLAKGGESATFTGFDYSLGATYLLILKYNIVSGSSNDEVSLFVETSGVSAYEPTTPTIGPLAPALSDPSSISAIALRQGGSTTMMLTVDGIRIGTNWSDAPLPVQLRSLVASVHLSAADLHWSTSTETNNYGFEIERRSVGSHNWAKVGFVAGSGTSSSPHEYSYKDAGLAPGRYAYRLKQLDNDGSFSYSGSAEVEIGLAPKEFKLESNYPNPFNPSTTIEFTVGTNGHASLRVFNVLGQEVATLFNDVVEAGRVYRAKFDASRSPSGVYFVKLESGKHQTMRKMMLVK